MALKEEVYGSVYVVGAPIEVWTPSRGGVLAPMVSKPEQKPLAHAFFAAAAAHNWRKVGARILIRSSRARIGERSEPKPEPERKKAPA